MGTKDNDSLKVANVEQMAVPVGENISSEQTERDGSEPTVAKAGFVDKMKETAELVKEKGFIQKRKLQEMLYYGSARKNQSQVVVLLEPELKDDVGAFLNNEVGELEGQGVVLATSEVEASIVNAPMVVYSPHKVFSGWPLSVFQREDLLEAVKALLVVTRNAKGSKEQLADETQLVVEEQPLSEKIETPPKEVESPELSQGESTEASQEESALVGADAKRGVTAGLETIKGLWRRKDKVADKSENEQAKAEVES